jgi:hypothetical protein
MSPARLRPGFKAPKGATNDTLRWPKMKRDPGMSSGLKITISTLNIISG